MSSAKIQLTFVLELIPRLDRIPKKFRGIHYLFVKSEIAFSDNETMAMSAAALLQPSLQYQA